MSGSVAAMAGCAWPVDAGRCATKGHSAISTGSFARVPSGAAGRVQTAVGAAEPLIQLGGGLGRRALGARAPAPAGLRRARGGVGADLGLAVRADPPRRVERLRAVLARVLELPHAARAPEEVILDLRVAVREVQEPGLREARIGRLHLELA